MPQRWVSFSRSFYLYYISPKVSEHLGAIGPGQVPCQVNHHSAG